MARPVKKIKGVYEKVKGSNNWYIRFSDQFGRLRKERVGLRSRAIELVQQRRQEVVDGKFDPNNIKGKHRTVLISEIIKDRRTPASALKSSDDEHRYLTWWDNYLGQCAVKSIKPKDIEDAREVLIKRRIPKLSPATINRHLAALSAVFSYSVENEKAILNPVSRVKMEPEHNKRDRVPFTDEEIRLMAVLPDRWKSLIKLALHTGMRKTELLTLRWENVNLKNGIIHVTKTKSGKNRWVPLTKTSSEILAGLNRIRLIDNPYIFHGNIKGECLKDLPNHWEEYLKQAGIEDFQFHDLRHTCASQIAECTGDLYGLKKLMGHSTMEMTERYAHLCQDHLRKLVGVFDTELTPQVPPVGKEQRVVGGSSFLSAS